MRMQTTIADTGTASVIASTRRMAKDLDYLSAHLHGRRSGMAEGERLYDLCRIRSLPDYYRTLYPESEFKGNIDFQRRLVYELIIELSGLSAHLSGPGADLTDWMLVRFQVENLKILIRGHLTKTPIEELYGHLAAHPRELALDTQGLAEAESMEDFVRMVPKGLLRDNLVKALEIYIGHPLPFFFEAALDRGYFQGLLMRTEELAQEDRETVRPMVYQEVDTFHLMLIVRGKYHYGLTPELLLPLHIAGARIPYALFTAMLNDPDIYTSVSRIAGRVIDAVFFEQGLKDGLMVIDASVLEGLAWKRFFRLANMAFRRSHMGLGTIIGYAGLRRMEVANLITISEGIHSGMAAETIHARLIKGADMEGTHV